MKLFKHLTRRAPVAILSGQASNQKFGLLVRFGLICLPLLFYYQRYIPKKCARATLICRTLILCLVISFNRRITSV